ncbi:MAG: sensor histidine kinase [Anaerolineales bacterium]
MTVVFTGLLSSVVLLLSIGIYAMVSVVLTNHMDDDLQQSANQIIDTLRADNIGGIAISPGSLHISDTIYYQIWSKDDQLVLYSENASEFTKALDPNAIDQTQPLFNDSDYDDDDTRYRVLTVPLVVNNEDFGSLQVGRLMNDLRNTQRLLRFVFVIATLFAIVVSGMIIWLVTGHALEPLATMAQIANQITSTDDLSQRIPVPTHRNDEINTLIMTFNKTILRLERLFNTQRRFLADVSHELRTPLTVIKGNLGLMRMMQTFDKEALNSIESEVDRLTRLVGDLLLMAQAETGKLPLMKTAVEIDELLFEVFEEMKVLSRATHDIRIEQIEPAIVTGDRDRLKQVLLNLGSNAINYTPEGGSILLSLFVKGFWVQIVFKDDGIGISKEEVDHLFERFYRGDKSRTRKIKGLGFGLGLPIAYWIVKGHGGRIDVESQVGKGTTFSVWLPLSQADIPTRPMIEEE